MTRTLKRNHIQYVYTYINKITNFDAQKREIWLKAVKK